MRLLEQSFRTIVQPVTPRLPAKVPQYYQRNITGL